MSKDRGYGFAIFITSIIVAIVYLAAFFGPFMGLLPTYWYSWAVGIPVLLFVLLVLVISAWIGWTMLTTPPPTPLEPEPTSSTGTGNARTTSSRTRRRKK